MAAGDKVFIADKETLDIVNSNVADIHSRVGTTTDTGGTATGGSLFAKLNALISSIATHVANWTAARAAKIDSIDTNATTAASNAAAASAQTAANHTASATGTLSQKLSHIINLFANSGQKVLASKVLNFTVASAGTHTILNITGAGQFEFAYTNMGSSTSALTFEIDGQSQTFNVEVGSKYVAKSLYYPGALLYMVPSSSSTTSHFPAMRTLYFKDSLKITVAKSDTTELFFRCNYSVYE